LATSAGSRPYRLTPSRSSAARKADSNPATVTPTSDASTVEAFLRVREEVAAHRQAAHGARVDIGGQPQQLGARRLEHALDGHAGVPSPKA